MRRQGFKKSVSGVLKKGGATVVLFGSLYFKAFRTIDGKRYKLRWVIEKRTEAENEAERLQKQGYSTRIVPYGKSRYFRNLHAVYIRKV